MPARFFSILARTWIISVVVAIVLLLFGVSRLFNVNAEWVKDVDVPTATALDGELFQDLADAELIWVERDEDAVWIIRPKCNSYVKENPTSVATLTQPVNAFPPDRQKELSKLILQLCESDLGARIVANIDVFNSGAELIGIRDNRARATVRNDQVQCSDGQIVPALFLPQGCMKSEWSIRLRQKQQEIRTISTESIPVSDYYILSTSLPRMMSDWAVAKPFRGVDSTVDLDHELVTTLSFAGRPVTIDVLGHVTGVSVAGQRADTSALATEKSGILPVAGGGVKIGFQRLCKGKRGRVVTCIPADGRPVSALRLTVEGPANTATELVITVLPASPGDQIANAQIGKNAASTGLQAVELPAMSRALRKISVDCPKIEWASHDLPVRGAATRCAPVWAVPPKTDASARPQRVIEKTPFGLVKDGVQILTPSGDLTQEAFKLGYSDVLGYGVSDLGSYSDYLSTREHKVPVDLTVSPALQQRLMAILNARRSGSGGSEHAELILMDADGDDAGEVLGFASRPAKKFGLSHWDIRALGTARPELSPFAAHIWIARGDIATPGSTFKLVTGLAAIQYVLDNDDDELTDILLGRTSQSTTANRLGWIRTTAEFKGACEPLGGSSAVADMNAFPIYDREGAGQIVHCIGNFERAPAGKHLLPGTDGCRPGDKQGQTGLCEAIAKSSNLFFAGLSMEIGKEQVYLPGTAKERKERDDPELSGVQLDQTIDRLFTSREAFGAELTPYDALDPGFSVSRVRASRMRLALTKKMETKRTRGTELALDGIGQSVSATPLAMAALAASIATERIVHPSVVPTGMRPGRPDIPLIRVPKGKEALYEDLLAQLLRGMNGVAKRGTGRRAVSGMPASVKNAVYIKTGTADIANGMNAAWIVGFVTPPGGGSKIDRTLAFACRVAPVRGGGGRICAPIIHDLINDLHENGI